MQKLWMYDGVIRHCNLREYALISISSNSCDERFIRRGKGYHVFFQSRVVGVFDLFTYHYYLKLCFEETLVFSDLRPDLSQNLEP